MTGRWRRALAGRLPPSPRARLAHARRALSDRLTGLAPSLVQAPSAYRDSAPLIDALCVTQSIRHGEHWQGKWRNLQTAARILNGFMLPPGLILSFWTLIGRPTLARGFEIGRAIRGDQLEADVGGGLCQFSGLIYELGLRAGLTVIERHAHSQDIYTEDTRFTPLGLDATVVWGHRDLRLRNDHPHPVVFSFDLTGDTLSGTVSAPCGLAPARLEIERRDREDGREVRVIRHGPSGDIGLVSMDVYATPNSRSPAHAHEPA